MPERKEKKTSVQSGSAVPWHNRGSRTRLIMQLISDVQSLELIIEKCDQTSLMLKNHYFTLMSVVTYHTWLKKQNDNYWTFRAIITEHIWANKCAGSGLLFTHLQLTFQRDCVQGVSDVLYVDINNKPRVTKKLKFSQKYLLFFLIHNK